MPMRASCSMFCSVVLLAAFSAAACLAEDARPKKIGAWDAETAGMKAEWKIDADYPVFNVPSMDNTIKAWLTAHTAMIMDNAKDLADADFPETCLHVKIGYTAVDGPAGTVSILFDTFYDFNLAAHPTRGTNSFVFSAKGEPLFLESLFADPERALRIFSEQSPKLLAEYYKSESEILTDLGDWITEGTGPTLENFGCYAVEPDGVRVYFKEYQVAPYAMGIPDVLVPLAALAPAGPSADVWPEQ